MKKMFEGKDLCCLAGLAYFAFGITVVNGFFELAINLVYALDEIGG